MLALQIEKHVELSKSRNQSFRAPVVVDAVECRVERRAHDALRLQRPQRREIGIEVDDGDALEAVFVVRDGVEHAAVIAAVAGIGLHQKRVADAVGLHHLRILPG